MICTIAAVALAADEIAEKYPVAENVRGHENTEWSISYAYHLTDAKKSLPRVLLVGDSICQGYQGKVAAKLEGKANVTYWASSYCVTSPGYLRLLAFYLDEAEYDVVHFNNGLHSCETTIADYAKAYRAALRLIKKKQPKAKLVWVTSTPINTENASRAAKVPALYEADENWEAALATYRRSLEADYNQPDLWALEKTMEAKVKRSLYGDSMLH